MDSNDWEYSKRDILYRVNEAISDFVLYNHAQPDILLLDSISYIAAATSPDFNYNTDGTRTYKGLLIIETHNINRFIMPAYAGR